jgi:hypothetical protein
MKETEQNVYGLIFKNDKHIAYCQVRGSMAGPDNWQTFKPIKFAALSNKIRDGEYALRLLNLGKPDAPGFSVTIKKHEFTKVHVHEPTTPVARSVKEIIAERVQKLLKKNALLLELRLDCSPEQEAGLQKRARARGSVAEKLLRVFLRSLETSAWGEARSACCTKER